MSAPHPIDEPPRRKSGKTTGEEITAEERRRAFEPLPAGKDDDETRKLKSPLLQRVRIDWNPDQQVIIQRVHATVDRRIVESFSEAYAIMYEIYELVRTPQTDVNGNVICDHHGMPVWKKNPSGSYDEDWSNLTHRQRERFLFIISTRMFDWEQRAQEAWAEAMFAKGYWEQSFAEGFESLPSISATRPTVDDRTQRARRVSGEDYYFALVVTYFSRKADAIVRSLRGLEQRIKDIHTA